jgi:transposase
MSNGQRRVYPEAFKREAVDRVSSSGLTPGKVAAELGLHETVLRRWMRQFSAASTMASVPLQRLQPQAASVADLASENSRLRKENERLRMEREILKNGLRASRTARLDRNTGSPRLISRRERGRQVFGGI